MRKIGIITLLGYFNYGNRLQNYALQETLKKFNFEVTSLRFEDKQGFLKDDSDKNIIERQKGKSLSQLLKGPFNILNKKIKQITYKEREYKRTGIFKRFTEEYIVEEDYKDNSDDYDYYVVGSDQVWNPNYIINKPQYLLKFASQNKRISYAASFGISELSQDVSKTYAIELKQFKEISVREDDGAKLIYDLTGKNVPVLVDPTMLLTKNEWLSISKRAKNRPDRLYILTYFLGGPSDEVRGKINKIAKQNNMDIINLGDPNEIETYETGPSEFIDYINNASVFLADSFHAVVFSIILETPFVIFERRNSKASMYSRIETILDKFDMKHREANSFNGDLFTMDFSEAPNIIKKEYHKSMEFLSNALKNIE